MLFRANAKPLMTSPPTTVIQFPIAVIIGLISAVMGIGGGTLGVPTLTAFNIPTRRAVGTAALFGAVIAIPGRSLCFSLARLQVTLLWPPWVW